ncbi:hypothetical protein [Paenibacillus sp. FSL R10-2736]|uniref:hypothetical protein n=1 Tax=Paenibacillus sp. FSL R10-2736 TaxID=2954692 RepID=UPI0030FA343E
MMEARDHGVTAGRRVDDGSKGSWGDGKNGVCVVEAGVSNAGVVREREGMCEQVCE